MKRARTGDRSATDDLYERVYSELYRIADSIRPGASNSTLSPRALVHEAYVRMRGVEDLDFATRRHFYAFAAKVMRNVLIDYTRRRSASKRNPNGNIVPLDASHDPGHEDATRWFEFDSALEELSNHDPELAELTQLRLFGGLSLADAADELGLSKRTTQRRWQLAKEWLRRKLSADGRA
ncbi:MAG: sigma-70 family RNA polymerase sigma factor [Planctomycetes bacterium]|nr:sigma-70 family RNA polymerase sigma factor [Planctomycetota bacterium]